MPKVVFVCTKNQFRSPLAEVMLKDMLATRSIPGVWIVESVGSWVEKLSPATYEAVIEAKKRGLDLSSHTAKSIENINHDQIDLLLVMEAGQKEAIQLEYPSLKKKTFLLSELSGTPYSIPDPYVTSEPCSEIALEIEQLVQSNIDTIIRLALGISHWAED